MLIVNKKIKTYLTVLLHRIWLGRSRIVFVNTDNSLICKNQLANSLYLKIQVRSSINKMGNMSRFILSSSKKLKIIKLFPFRSNMDYSLSI